MPDRQSVTTNRRFNVSLKIVQWCLCSYADVLLPTYAGMLFGPAYWYDYDPYYTWP